MRPRVPVRPSSRVANVRRAIVALCCLWAALGLGNRELQAKSAAARVSHVERYASDRAARIVLHVSAPARFARLPPDAAEPKGALGVDVWEVSYSGPAEYPMSGLVERVRLRTRGRALRVSLDLGAPARHDVFYLPEPFRIVVDVVSLEQVRGARAGRRVARVALDPGHGGSDPGAVGQSGLQEKDVVLDIAHRAAPLLARELGISTLLTRDADARIPLEERVARANAFGADLFVSIHCNADPSNSARGVMTFVLDGTHDRRIAGLLERENAARAPDPSELLRFARQFDDAAIRSRSDVFARLLQRATLASLAQGYPGAVDGGVHGAGFYVLAGARMPAVLFESSFVSNPLEERRLRTGRYRQKLADAIVNAVRAYQAGY